MGIRFSFALLAPVVFSANLFAAECEKGFQKAHVDGAVNTITPIDNTGQPLPLQIGTIDLLLTKESNGKALFDQRGVVVGQIAGAHFTGAFPVVYLNHNITFEKDNQIETSGDRAEVYGDPFAVTKEGTPVVETLGDFWGTKFFKKATGEMIAQGTINRLGEDGLIHNDFALDGWFCISRDN